jgi:hypothetical protein
MNLDWFDCDRIRQVGAGHEKHKQQRTTKLALTDVRSPKPHRLDSTRLDVRSLPAGLARTNFIRASSRTRHSPIPSVTPAPTVRPGPRRFRLITPRMTGISVSAPSRGYGAETLLFQGTFPLAPPACRPEEACPRSSGTTSRATGSPGGGVSASPCVWWSPFRTP